LPEDGYVTRNNAAPDARCSILKGPFPATIL